jgi:transcriptional regulator with XRE-family HTH domain
MTLNAKDIGSVVRFHRKKAGLTQKELARLSGVKSPTVIYELEAGKKSNIQLGNLTRILDVLNIQITLQSPLMDVWERDGR